MFAQTVESVKFVYNFGFEFLSPFSDTPHAGLSTISVINHIFIFNLMKGLINALFSTH